MPLDKTSCTSLMMPSAATTSTTDTNFKTLYSYTGRGYLDSASLYSIISFQLRITVDGTVRFLSGVSSSVVSFNNRNLLSAAYATYPFAGAYATSATSVSGYSMTSSIVGYPDTSGTAAFCVSADSIYFNSSILIEGRTTTAGYSMVYSYSGGVI